jgi:hypothetical protein
MFTKKIDEKRMTNAALVYSLGVCCMVFMSCSKNGHQDLVSAGDTNYYVDAWQGNDNYIGTSPDSAWQTFARVNETKFAPGDSVLFRCGGTWTGQLYPKGSGQEGNPIVIDKYGQGDLPRLIGEGRIENTIYLFNQEYWEINNLDISNFGEGDTSIRRGIYVQAEDYGAVHHIYMTNLVIHDVNGNMKTRKTGGIFMEVTGIEKPTWFEDILVEGCEFYDVDRIGWNNMSTWMHRTPTENINWYPGKNVWLRNNYFERTGGNAVVVRVTDGPILEHNIFFNCGVKGTGNTNYPFNCDNALIQYNEAYGTQYTEGTPDGGGFNSDWQCKNTVIQYNYSHDNAYGGQLICRDGGVENSFNDGTIVRYNVYANNGHHVFRVSGPATNSLVYNNILYLSPDQSRIKIIWHKYWDGFPEGIEYYNNIVYNLGTDNYYDFEQSSKHTFDYNIFAGNPAANEPDDPHKLTSDPEFIDVTCNRAGWDSVSGFQLKSSSPAIDSGVLLPGHAVEDYFGNPVPYNDSVDRGAFEWQGTGQ